MPPKRGPPPSAYRNPQNSTGISFAGSQAGSSSLITTRRGTSLRDPFSSQQQGEEPNTVDEDDLSDNSAISNTSASRRLGRVFSSQEDLNVVDRAVRAGQQRALYPPRVSSLQNARQQQQPTRDLYSPPIYDNPPPEPVFTRRGRSLVAADCVPMGTISVISPPSEPVSYFEDNNFINRVARRVRSRSFGRNRSSKDRGKSSTREKVKKLFSSNNQGGSAGAA